MVGDRLRRGDEVVVPDQGLNSLVGSLEGTRLLRMYTLENLSIIRSSTDNLN